MFGKLFKRNKEQVKLFYNTDVHCHILPGIDDGAKTPDEGVELLKTLKSQGVDTVCLTPHFYASMKVDDFLRRRDAALEKLLAAAGGEELPKGCAVCSKLDCPSRKKE